MREQESRMDVKEIAERGFTAQVRQQTLRTNADPRSTEFGDEWNRLAAVTREALRLLSETKSQNPAEMLAKARLLAAVTYREGRSDYRFALALSLLRDMGETGLAEERAKDGE
jgi:hypothetical protein